MPTLAYVALGIFILLLSMIIVPRVFGPCHKDDGRRSFTKPPGGIDQP